MKVRGISMYILILSVMESSLPQLPINSFKDGRKLTACSNCKLIKPMA